MSKNRFEQLIEYVINDEEAKAKELFHQIVVEKSRAIYEDLMDEDALEEDNAMGEEPTEIDTDMSEGDLGGSQAQDMIDDVEMEEQGMSEDDSNVEFDDEAEQAGKDMTHDIEDEHDDGELENRVVDLEDKLDELMAEFEAMMDGGDAGDMGDTPDMTDIEVQDDEFETESLEEHLGMHAQYLHNKKKEQEKVVKPKEPEKKKPEGKAMEEAINLKQVSPKTTTSEEGNGKAGPVAFNSGKTGMAGAPVKMTGDTAQGRPAPTTKDLIGKVGNSPAQGTQSPKAAPKPVTTQPPGVNARSPLPKA